MKNNNENKVQSNLPSKQREAIERAADLIVQIIRQRGQMNFGYDGESVEWLEGHIDELRRTGLFQDENLKRILAFAYGSFLGECIVRCYGGFWAMREEEGLCICFSNGAAALPLGKPLKQIENGMEDGIAAFFYMIPLLLGDQFSQLELPPTANHIQLWVNRT